MKKSNLCNLVIHLTVVAVTLAASGLETARADSPKSTAVWVGAGVEEGAYAGYIGGIWALNGDLGASGILLRSSLAYADFEFATDSSPDGEANGEFAQGSVSLGYQISGDDFAMSLFGGIDVQDRKLRPSAAETGDLDDHTGFIVTARLAKHGPTPYPASIEGSYSTANDEYYAQARIGRDFGTFDLGPEIAVLGNEDYDAVRVGAYASFDLEDGPIVQLSVGYHSSDETSTSSGSENSAYGNVALVFLF